MKGIPVIPFPDLFELHAKPLAELSDLRFRKSHIFRKPPGRKHGIFSEIRHGRLGSVFLDGQDAGDICRLKYHICPTALEQAPQKGDILLLQLRIVFCFTEKRIPLIDDHDEPFAGSFYGIQQGLCQTCAFRGLRETIGDFRYDSFFYVLHHIPYIRSTRYEQRDIQINHVVLVQASLEGRVFRNLQPLEQLPGVAAFVVICAQHLRCK